jgi:hypothetical protein
MSGNNHLIVQPRDLQLLRELAVMRVMDRERQRLLPASIPPRAPMPACLPSTARDR